MTAAHDIGCTAYAGTPDYLKVILDKADEMGVALKIAKAQLARQEARSAQVAAAGTGGSQAPSAGTEDGDASDAEDPETSSALVLFFGERRDDFARLAFESPALREAIATVAEDARSRSSSAGLRAGALLDASGPGPRFTCTSTN